MAVEPAFRKYIVVVLGSSQSGVSEFIKRVSELPPQTMPDPNPSDTLKPLDYGRLSVDAGNIIYLYGLSEESPLSAWTFLFDREDPVGVVTLVDSTRPASFSIDKALINNVDDDIPFVIAANKRDCANAWELDAIRVALNIDRQIPVIGCSARTGAGVRHVILTLFDRLITPDYNVEDEGYDYTDFAT